MTKSRHAIFALILSLVLSALTLVLMLFALQPAAKGGSLAPTPSEASSDQQITILVDDSVPQPEHSPPFEPSADQQMAITTILVDDYAQQSSQGGLIYQDFEGSTPGWPGPDCEVRFSISPPEPVHSGDQSWRIDCTGAWNYVYVQYMGGGWNTDLLGEKNDRLTFWIYALPGGDGAGTDNPVAVRFYDHGAYNTVGFEVWTTHTAHYDEWTKLTVLFDQLPDNLNLGDIDKLEFKNRWPGTYYLDDIQAVREDRIYQSFEPYKRSLSITDTEEFGWVWGVSRNTCALSQEQVFKGDSSWKTVFHDYWAGTGIKSEQEYLAPRTVTGTQSFWHVDLDPELNNQLSLWVYALPLNGLDNNVNVQFYDHGAHHTVETKVDYWTNQPAIYGQWTQITVPFSDVLDIASDLVLTDIDKLQFQMYWPGTYYLDQIEATSSVPTWDRHSLKDGILTWGSDHPLDGYTLQENIHTGDHNDSRWMTVTTGTAVTTYSIPHISPVWYRVRAEDVESVTNEVPFVSAWSDPLEYNPPAILIDKSTLMVSQTLTWTQLSHATVYTVESASSFNGPWTPIYTGAYPTTSLSASENTWYRVRAGTGTEESDWSPPQWKPNPINQDILRTYGTTIRKGPTDEIGDVVVLRGVNLGNYLLIEPWLSGWGPGNITSTETVTETDYYTIRSVLEARFGADSRDALLQTYRDSYLTDVDFDILMRMGVSLVRLPIYYRDLQDDEGNLIPEGFKNIDRVVEACADRRMYMLLDLHGAPGAQSKDCWTGRCGYNKLFQGTEAEQALFQTRTVELWEALAAHYKDNTTVMGYDLLNEPIGVLPSGVPIYGELRKLWDFYDRLYEAIRAQDPNHIIVMEAIWDLNTLPKPLKYGWENVVYQLHTYCSWCEVESYDEKVKAHKQFVDDKIALVQNYQDGCGYQVPIMIGEFHAYDGRDIWEYYLERFNDMGWSWTIWTYKMAIPNSTWGLLTDRYYDVEALPRFMTDTYEVLQAKLSGQFGTLTRYMPNETLIDIVKRYVNENYTLTEPYTLPVTSRFQAECYDDASDNVVRDTYYIGSLDEDDWVRYDAIEFTDDLTTFVANLAVANDHAGGQIQVRLDQVTGTVVGTLTVAGTDGWWTFAEQRAPISPIIGAHDVHLTFAGDGGVANIDWFTFEAALYLPIILKNYPP